MKKICIITLFCFLFVKSILCDDEDPKKVEDVEDEGFDAYNVTIEEKVAFVNRWCTGDKMAVMFMKALIGCRDKTLVSTNFVSRRNF